MKRLTLLTCFGISATAVVLGFSHLHAADPAAPAPGPRQHDEGKGGKRFRPDGDRKFDRPFHKPDGDRGFGPGGMDRMLNLTDEQKAKVKQIMEQTRPKIEAIREEERAKIKLIMDDAQTQIRPILTPEQQQVLDDAKKVQADSEKLRENVRKLHQDKDAKKTP